MVSGSADKTVVLKQIDLDAVAKMKDLEELQLAEHSEYLGEDRTLQTKGKVFSMDIAAKAQFMATGHDRQLSMWQMPELENVWNYVSADP